MFIGNVVPLRHQYLDPFGQPVDPTTPTVRVMAPDGTIVSATPTKLSVGNYQYLLTVTTAGVWQYRFSAIGFSDFGSITVVEDPF